MDIQSSFNVAMSLIGFLGGWLIKSMQDNIKEASSKIQSLEVIMAGKYVTYEYLDKQIHAIFESLRRIEDKLDDKADK